VHTQLFTLADRSYVRVAGPATADFLNRLLTVDCKRLPVGQPTRAFLLEARGRVILALRLLRLEPTVFEIEAGPGQTEAVLERLDHFHFGEALTFEASTTHTHLLLAGPDVDAVLAGAGLAIGAFCTDQDVAILPTDRLAAPARELWVRRDALAAVEAALVAAGAQPAGPEVLEMLRILQGIPDDAEYSPEATPLEAGKAGISEGKGCYPGQEVIERTLALGRPARQLVAVRLGGAVPVGAELTAEGEPAGRLTSIAQQLDGTWLGLALVRPKYAEVALDAAGTPVHPR